MIIDRKELIADLKTFAKVHSGVVIGAPGIGKSHSLVQLVIALAEDNIPACLIRLDELSTAGDDDFGRVLGIPDGNWIEKLKAIPTSENGRSVLVMDAFDTLRDEALKKKVLEQLKRVKSELPDWSILVSVRTYDAKQSKKLIELFPHELSDDEIDCRKFIIPELSAEELSRFLKSHKKLDALYHIANERLKEIFKTPFFLQIMEKILARSPKDIAELSVIKSEIELLDRYWNKVVGAIGPIMVSEVLLRLLTKNMVDIKQLSVDKYVFLENLSQDKIILVDRLLSENVITEQGPLKERLSYSHNILFDYAVSKLIIPIDPGSMVRFIEEDPTRPLFLRPSFLYLFTRLWYADREGFWRTYHALSAVQNTDIVLFNKLIPSAVAVRVFENVEDIVWVNDTSGHSEEIRNILQAFRYLNIGTDRNKQSALLKALSENLHLVFLGDFCILFSKLIDSEKGTIGLADKDTGTAARNLFDYCLEHRNDPDLNLENVIAYHAIPAVAWTFASHPVKSRQRLTTILDTIGAEAFDIRQVSSVLENLEAILDHDVAFLSEIYLKIFRHQEVDNSSVPLHQSVLMSFSSNRIDQFKLCHSKLSQFFTRFLKKSPEAAISVALKVASDFIKKKYKDGILIGPEMDFPSEFSVNGTQTSYQVDMSHFWSGLLGINEEIQLCEKILSYFDELIADGNTGRLSELIGTYIKNASAGITWQLLLAWASKNAQVVSDQLFEVLLQPAILYWSDTAEQAGSFLHHAAVFYSPEQISKIQQVIFSLPDRVPENMAADARQRTSRLLSLTTKTPLQDADGIAPFEVNYVTENVEFDEIADSGEITTSGIPLQEQHLDVTLPIADELLDIEQKLSNFCCTYGGRNIPSPENYAEPLKLAAVTFQKIKTAEKLEAELERSVMTRVAGVCQAVLRSDCLAFEYGETRQTGYPEIKTILLDCLAKYSDSDRYAEQNYSASGCYNSTPRSQAAGGVINLYVLTQDDDLLPLVEKFAQDKNPITRLEMLQFIGRLYTPQRELFWKILNERLKNEPDKLIWSNLVGKLDRKAIFELEIPKLKNALEIAKLRAANLEKGMDFFDNFLLVSLALLRKSADPDVKKLLLELLGQNHGLSPRLVYMAFELIQPENHHTDITDPDQLQLSKRLIDLMIVLLDDCEKTLGGVKLEEEPRPEIMNAFELMDAMISRVYFSMQINERAIGLKDRLSVSDEDRRLFYPLVKPLMVRIMQISEKINFMQATTGHRYVEILGPVLEFDPEYALYCVRKIAELSTQGYIQDRSAILEIVRFSEKLLANHKELMGRPEMFSHIKRILEIYATAGWPEALQLLWQLDEIFR